MLRPLIVLLVWLSPALAMGQVPFPQLAQPIATFSSEDKDWGVEPTTTTKSAPYHAPTPTAIPGARVIKTLELKELLASNKSVVVVDVLKSNSRTSIPGAFWIWGGGDGQWSAVKNRKFGAALEKLTDGDKNRPMVFLCINSECWLSYNASLHAIEAGFKDVIWYRGGTDAWKEAGLKRTKIEAVEW